MYKNKHHNDLIEDEISNRTCSTDTTSMMRLPESISESININSLLYEIKGENDVAEPRTRTVADFQDNMASCISTVNVNDIDQKSSPLAPQKFSQIHIACPSHPFLSEAKTNKGIPKNTKTLNENGCDKVISNRNNNYKNITDNKNYIIFNGDNDDEMNNINLESFDNKINILNSNQLDEHSKNQANQSFSESKNEENDSRAPTKDAESLQQKAFINQQRRLASASPSMSSTSSCCDNDCQSKIHQCSGSPVVSIRSISSTIITSDSDSDLNSDTDGSDKNYVIKKLGTQVTYAENDPDIPKINSGHTVRNQRVIVNNEDVPLEPLATLAAIGDGIGAAQALGPGPHNSGATQRAHIGSIALNNSTDVTFGDKHFYEGPVTIQQFLIDSRDKWKEDNSINNPAYEKEKFEASVINAKDTHEEKSRKYYEQILKHKKFVIPGTLTLTALLIAATILGIKSLNDSKSKIVYGNTEESRIIIPINSTIATNPNHVDDDDNCDGNGTLCLVERDVWRAHPQKSNMDKQALPLHRVVISHTASEPCETLRACSERVRVIQEFHMNSLGWDDIGYNFLISSDGRAYVGRGWDYVGAHTKGYNYDSVGITFIGTYISVEPTENQLNACLSLLEEGVRLKKLAPDYRLYGARQLGATESPGEMLYKRIRKWSHWSANINID